MSARETPETIGEVFKQQNATAAAVIREQVARLRSTFGVVHVQPHDLADLLEHCASTWESDAWTAQQWPHMRRLICRVGGLDADQLSRGGGEL